MDVRIIHIVLEESVSESGGLNLYNQIKVGLLNYDRVQVDFIKAGRPSSTFLNASLVNLVKEQSREKLKGRLLFTGLSVSDANYIREYLSYF